MEREREREREWKEEKIVMYANKIYSSLWGQFEKKCSKLVHTCTVVYNHVCQARYKKYKVK